MLFYSLLFNLVFAQTNRISSTNLNLSKVEKIFVAPGLVSLLEFPQNIIEVRVGDLSSVKAIISQTSPKELTVYLSSTASRPTNIIVRAEKKVYVFDIVPSLSNHQDYIKIRSSFGSPNALGQQYNYQSVKIDPNFKTSNQYKIISTNSEMVSP